MRNFKFLSVLGALLLVCGLNAQAGEVYSCTMTQVSYWSDGHGGGGPVNVCFKDPIKKTGAAGWNRFNGSVCLESGAYTGFYVEGCANPTFYTGTKPVTPPVTQPTTKVVNGITLPYTATVYAQGQCYSYGCATPSQTCANTYRAIFTMAPYPSQNYVCYK